MRAFISLNPDGETLRILREFQDKVKQEAGHNDSYSVRWETPDKFHITLYFIGDINEADAEKLKSGLGKIKDKGLGKLHLSLGKLNGFPDLNRPKVLFVEIKDTENKLKELNWIINDIMKGLGFEQNGKFHAHITLGRVKRDRRLKRLNYLSAEGSFEISNINLMKSTLKKEGAEHECIFTSEL